MTTRALSVSIESVIVQIAINPEDRTLELTGELRVVGNGNVVATYYEDVTHLLNAEDIAAAQRLATRAQAWIDQKLAQL